MAWDQAVETLAFARAVLQLCPCLASSVPTWNPTCLTWHLGLTSSLRLAWQPTALLAEPGYCYRTSSAPPAQATQGHCPACFAATRKEGRKKDHKMSSSCYGTSLLFRELWATAESHQSSGSTPLLPSLPVPATKEERLRKSKLRTCAERGIS